MSAFRIAAMSFLFAIALTLPVSDLAARQKSTAGKSEKKSATSEKSDKKGATPAPAATGQKGTPATTGVQELKLPTADNWLIHATYYASTEGKESPVVILLTATEGPDKKDARNRRIWQTTALSLQKNGFAVISVDLRKHGDTVPPTTGAEPPVLKMAQNDYALMASVDLEVVKAFLMNEHKSQKLNIRKLGIVSMGSSCMVAAGFAVADHAKTPFPDAPTLESRTPRGQDVQALIMYSPNTMVKGINANVLKVLKPLPIAIHVVASKDNKDDAKNAEKVFKAVDLKDEQYKDFRKSTMVPGEVRSEAFLEGKFADVTNREIVDFLTTNLKSLNSPWVSRFNRLEN